MHESKWNRHKFSDTDRRRKGKGQHIGKEVDNMYSDI